MSDGGEEQGDVSIEDTAPARDECEGHQGIDHQLNLLNSRLQGNVSKEVKNRDAPSPLLCVTNHPCFHFYAKHNMSALTHASPNIHTLMKIVSFSPW